MPTMNADRWIVLLALSFICVSSNEELDFDNSCVNSSDACETQTLSASLGSSVLLPCNFETSSLGLVSWAHATGLDLVHLTSEGRIKFLDHRYGRVKAFPNQGSEGNYSIRIDELQTSDLGCYRCEQGLDCLQVELVAVKGAPREEMMLLIFICVAVAAVTLLMVGGYCCIKSILCCYNRTIDNTNNPEGVGTEGASSPPEETGRVSVDQQQRGGGNDNLVYENDDHEPSSSQGDLSRNYCHPTDLPNPDRTQPNPDRTQPNPDRTHPNLDRTQPTQSTNLNQFERVESQRTKHGFHRELFSRLRQASLSRHYYVNQGELRRQQATSTPAENHHGAAGLGRKKKKAKNNVELKNPIYNRSMDQLNHL